MMIVKKKNDPLLQVVLAYLDNIRQIGCKILDDDKRFCALLDEMTKLVSDKYVYCGYDIADVYNVFEYIVPEKKE